MQSLVRVRNGATVQHIGRDSALVTGTAGQIADVIANAEEHGRYRSHTDLVPAGEPGVWATNVRLRVREEVMAEVVPARPAPRRDFARREIVYVPTGHRTALIAGSAVVVLGVGGFAVFEVCKFVSTYYLEILGVLAVLTIIRIVVGVVRSGVCEGIHFRH